MPRLIHIDRYPVSFCLAPYYIRIYSRIPHQYAAVPVMVSLIPDKIRDAA